MFAQVGDWLIVEGRTDAQHARRGEVREVHGADGGPPYVVHWTDRDQDALVFPGPDALILTRDQLSARDDAKSRQIDEVQREIRVPGN